MQENQTSYVSGGAAGRRAGGLSSGPRGAEANKNATITLAVGASSRRAEKKSNLAITEEDEFEAEDDDEEGDEDSDSDSDVQEDIQRRRNTKRDTDHPERRKEQEKQSPTEEQEQDDFEHLDELDYLDPEAEQAALEAQVDQLISLSETKDSSIAALEAQVSEQKKHLKIEKEKVRLLTKKHQDATQGGGGGLTRVAAQKLEREFASQELVSGVGARLLRMALTQFVLLQILKGLQRE